MFKKITRKKPNIVADVIKVVFEERSDMIIAETLKVTAQKRLLSIF